MLRIHKAAFGLGDHRPRPLPTTSRGGERALLLARRTKVLLAPVPRGSGALPFLLQPAHEEAQALRMESLRREILPEELVGEPETLLVDSTLLEVLHPRQVRQSAGSGGKPFGRSRVGKVGLLRRLRREAAPVVRHQPGAPLLRAHPCQHRRRLHRRRLLDRGTHQRGGFGGGRSEEALGRDLAYRAARI
jgi:hypothetical protein